MNNDVTTMQWKYLRENDKKYFDPSKNTTLSAYLEYIFSGYTFVYNSRIPRDIIKSRKEAAEIRLYRPDARCEELNLVVEFDGVSHYQDQLIVLQDRVKDTYLHELGYIVVRIPYWIQLSRDVIDYLFRDVSNYITLSEIDKMCELEFSFYNPDSQDPGLAVSIGSMCELGRDRFIDEVINMPGSIQEQIYRDIYMCCATVSDKYSECAPQHIVPTYVMQKCGWAPVNNH